MNYKLAKKLKDAGFEQNWIQLEIPIDEYTRHQYKDVGYHLFLDDNQTRTPFEMDKDWMLSDDGKKEIVYVPTLSELIEACGDVSLVLWKYENQWMAGIYKCGSDIYVDDYPNPKGDGDTPSEAVANLWIKLNEKK